MSQSDSTITRLLTRDPVESAPRPDASASIMVRLLNWFDKRSPQGICAVAASVIFGIGIISYATGPQISSSLLYLIPVLVATRAAGFRPGIVAALLAAAVWFTADKAGGSIYSHPFIPYWNALMRLGTFLVAVGLVSEMRSLNAHLEERVHERTAALKTQIAQKRELEKTILEISDLEQARIGQDLHDGLCQQLVSTSFSLQILQLNLAKEADSHPCTAEKVADIAVMIDEAITQARNLARGLYPVRLESEGLEMALRELASTLGRRFSVECAVDCPDPFPPCSPSVGIHFYRIAQEAIVNAGKHGSTSAITIGLFRKHGHIQLLIDDDGCGIDSSTVNPQGMGMRIMEYRARMIGADFKVESRKHHGTRVSCELSESLFHA